MNKDKLQKIVLGCIVGIGGLYVYFSMLLGPLSEQESAANVEIARLEPLLKTARSQIRATQSIRESDTNAERAKEILETVRTAIPEGAAIAWFPSRLTDFFRRHGMEKASIRPTNEMDDTLFSDYKKTAWEVSIQGAEFGPLAAALAGLENEHGLLQITNLQINSNPANVERQNATLTLTTIVKP